MICDRIESFTVLLHVSSSENALGPSLPRGSALLDFPISELNLVICCVCSESEGAASPSSHYHHHPLYTDNNVVSKGRRIRSTPIRACATAVPAQVVEVGRA